MIKFEVNFDIDGVDGFYVIEGKDLDEIKVKNRKEFTKRGIHCDLNHVWVDRLSSDENPTKT